MKFWTSALIDGLAVSAFAVIGRLSHGELTDLGGTWHTAWPFLAGAAIGTIAARAWRRPGSYVGGLVIWACTVVGGMVLRVLSGATIAVSFVLVTAITLAILLLGWRLVCHLLARARRRARTGVPA
ncbi:DUF3054 domain-containing protein [Microlunatus ginsengisoli]|uniref:DUF3054 domain-containing protein n=1 Tax=Microlunatus ginsengisoli TaxID=363863 RepID=A0ABP7AF59_9ACTN